jgi:hypothetical protein
VILGKPFLATANALINCRIGVMKMSFGNITVELNIFNINNQPLNYDEVRPVCLIKEITDEIVNEFSLEDPEVEYFAQDEDDLDLDRLIGQDGVLYEPSLEDPKIKCFAPFGDDLNFSELLQWAKTMFKSSTEDPEIECFAQCGGDIDFDRLLELARGVGEPSMENTVLESFAQLGYNVDFDELVELAKPILYPISELQPECGETIEISFPTPYSSAAEPPNLISESNWVGPIHVWPRWPSVTVGRKKDNEWLSTQVQTGWQGCIDYSKMKALTRKDHFPPPFFDQVYEMGSWISLLLCAW